MRSHTKLTPQQAAANAATASAPRAVVKAARGVTVAARMDILRSLPKADRGGLTLKAAELASREIGGLISDARFFLPSSRKRKPAARKPSVEARLDAKRTRMATYAAVLSLRCGERPEFRVNVAAQPAYTIRRERRWLTDYDKWGTDFWIHEIVLPRGWMTAVKQVGRRDGGVGQLNDGRFVIDAIHVHTLDWAFPRDCPIYEVDVVRQGRGLADVAIERLLVRVWPGGHETYHATLKRAIKAEAPEAALQVVAAERAASARLHEDMASLDMELC